MRASFHTLGCKVNQYETELMKEDLIKNGYEIVTENGIKHMHVHKHALLRQSCDDYHG